MQQELLLGLFLVIMEHTVRRMPSIGSKSGNKSNYGKTVLSGLIVKYDMQNANCYAGSGTTVNDTQANTTATLFNTPSFTNNNLKYFNFSSGSSQYMATVTDLNPKLSPANTSTVISIFVWVYMTGNGIIINEQSDTAINSGWFAVWPYTNGTPKISSSVPTNLNTWYYVGFVYDGSTLRTYVNGQSAGTSTYARTTPYNGGSFELHCAIAATSGTSMGTYSYGNFRFGALHIYNTALSVSDINKNYNNTRTIYGV